MPENTETVTESEDPAAVGQETGEADEKAADPQTDTDEKLPDTAAQNDEAVNDHAEDHANETKHFDKIDRSADAAEVENNMAYASKTFVAKPIRTLPYSGETLIEIENPDPNYNPSFVILTDYDRAKLERLVMGEAGTMGYVGCAMVAQAIRDAMNATGISSIDQIISSFGYYGSTEIEPNSDVKAAVSFIFDQNGSAVQHRVLVFYIGTSAWHETQNFITEIGGVRFFDM